MMDTDSDYDRRPGTGALREGPEQPAAAEIQTAIGVGPLFPVEIGTIAASLLTMDLYVQYSAGARPVLYRTVGVHFDDGDRHRLMEQGIEFLYVPQHHHREYRRALTKVLDDTFHDEATNRQERSRVIRASCSKMIADVLRFPNLTETVDMVGDISAHFARWAEEENGEFSYLLDMSTHDYYTATHMMNTGVACGLLVREFNTRGVELPAGLVQGAMLHDMGKRGIPEEILNREGHLHPGEWERVRRHPLIGARELRTHPNVAPEILEMVSGHHERLDGKGYPNGLAGRQVGLAARICGILDAYDAVSAGRPYRDPIPPRDTLAILREGAGTQFDGRILEVWAGVVERLLSEDPQRAASDESAERTTKLDDLMPSGPASLEVQRRGSSTQWQDERRQHLRFPFDVPVDVQFIRRGKDYPVGEDDWVALRAQDISRSGLLLPTPWPLALNDVLELRLPGRSGQVQTRQARVVRIRGGEGGSWAAGLQFTATE